MDTVIDNVLLMYVSYGLVLTFGKPEVLRPVSATFNQKDVADAKDVPWNQCLDHLGETQNIHPEIWIMYWIFKMLWIISVTNSKCAVV